MSDRPHPRLSCLARARLGAGVAGFALCALLAACGGGGSGTASGNAATASASAPVAASATPKASTPSLASTGNPSGTVPQSTTPNVLAVTVGPTPTSTRNMLMASVTVCVPGTATCATVDNVQVDTGSQGLRLLA